MPIDFYKNQRIRANDRLLEKSQPTIPTLSIKSILSMNKPTLTHEVKTKPEISTQATTPTPYWNNFFPKNCKTDRISIKRTLSTDKLSKLAKVHTRKSSDIRISTAVKRPLIKINHNLTKEIKSIKNSSQIKISTDIYQERFTQSPINLPNDSKIRNAVNLDDSLLSVLDILQTWDQN